MYVPILWKQVFMEKKKKKTKKKKLSQRKLFEHLVGLIFLTELWRALNDKIICIFPNTSIFYTHWESLACPNILTFFDQCSHWPHELITNSNMVSSPLTAGSSFTAECFRRNSSIFSLSSSSKSAPTDHITAKMNKRAICSSLSCFSSRSDNKPCKQMQHVTTALLEQHPSTNNRIKDRKSDVLSTCRRSIACLMYMHSKTGIFGVTEEKTKLIISWKGKTSLKESVSLFQWYDLFLDINNFLISTMFSALLTIKFYPISGITTTQTDHRILLTIIYIL